MGDRHGAAGGHAGGPSEGPELTPQERWLSLWSYGRFDLGLSEREFWRMTPRALDWLGRRRRQRERRQEYFAGLLCSVMANYSARAPKKAFTPSDFLPEDRLRRAGSNKGQKSPEEIAEGLRGFMARFMG